MTRNHRTFLIHFR